jgi:hypothetical protein
MLTVVMLLLLPAVLGLSMMRGVQVPRGLLSGRLRINSRAPCLAALGFGAIDCSRLIQSLLVPCTAAKTIISRPRRVLEFLSVSSFAVAYPFVYLVFEWVQCHTFKPLEPE